VYLNSGDGRILALDLHGNVMRDSGGYPGSTRAAASSRPMAATASPCAASGRSLPCPPPSTARGNWPFGTADAVASVREYDPATGQLVRVLVPERSVGFRRPRGSRFGPDGRLYCVGEDHVVAFDFSTGSFAGPVLHLARLNGQALVLVP
jgi:hypothetical protein